jgi:hypothetical protein
MATLRQKCKSYLTGRGMWPDWADETIQRAINEGGMEGLRERIDDFEEDYPAPIFLVLVSALRRHALDVINEKCPGAWFKPVFEHEARREEWNEAS